MTSKVGKRPLRSLSAHEKMEAIRRVHDGESKASVARDIGVPESTLRGWCKNEDKILYLSRQSTPDTDESDHLPTRLEKKQRYEPTELPPMQPFNLSVRASSKSPQPAEPVVVTTISETIPPSSTELIEVPLALNLTKQESPKNVNIPVLSTPVPAVAPSAVDKERERNRAELTRLSIELGLNRPEMFLPNSSNANIAANLSDLSASLTANLGLVAQWNNALLQQVNTKKRTSQSAGLDSISSMQQQQQQQLPTSQPIVSTTTPMTTTNASSITTQHNSISHHYSNNNNSIKSSKSKKQHLDTHNVDDSVWYWLKTQQAMLGLVQNSTTPNTMQQNVVDPTNSSWFWKWYKQLAYGQMQQPTTGQVTSQQLHQQQQQQQQMVTTPEKPILYQQLTKESNSENHETPKSTKPSSQNTKVRAVLDNLLLNNNNNEDATTLIENGLQKRDSEGTKTAEEATMTPASTAEALCHGEMFLKWLEKCGDPSVTAVQILQLRYLLNNIRTGADRKNGVSSTEHKSKVRSRK